MKTRPPHYGTEYFRTPRICFKEVNGQPLWDQWCNPTYMKREEENFCREYVSKEEMEEIVAMAQNQARAKAWRDSIKLVQKHWNLGMMSHYASEAHKKAAETPYEPDDGKTMGELLTEALK